MTNRKSQQIGLGTVQFGLDYGVTNSHGMVPDSELRSIIDQAANAEITVLDTASAYGVSESRLGQVIDQYSDCSFRVFTKTLPIRKDSVDLSAINQINGAFKNSLTNLKRSSVEGLLVHHAEDLLVPGGDKLYRLLKSWKCDGLVNKIGVSFYDTQQAIQLLNSFDFDVVQLPLNILDQRLLQSGIITQLDSRGIEVHVRSLFLQGIILSKPEELPPTLMGLGTVIASLNSLAEEMQLSMLDLALGFIKQIPEVSISLVGVQSKQHLNEIISSYNKEIIFDFKKFGVSDSNLIDPRRWKLK